MEIIFDELGTKKFEGGVSKTVLYVVKDGAYNTGVAWNGVTVVTEKPTGAEVTKIYADNTNYANIVSTEDFEATVEAYTYPDAFAVCNGTAEVGAGVMVHQQSRSRFGLCYKTNIGNDVNEDLGYKLHIIYNAYAAPSESSFKTINESLDAITFSYELTTIPVAVTGYKATASLAIDSTKVDAAKLVLLEAALYGDSENEATLLTPDEIIAIVGAI